MTVRTFPLTGRINLAVRMGNGSLTVRCVDDLAEARVELAPRPHADEYVERMTVAMDGPTLTISAPRQGGIFDMFGDLWRKTGSVDVQVTVPTGTAMRVVTFTADVRVEGRCGGADITTGSAGIELPEVDGDLRLRAGNAKCTVGRVSGSAQWRSGAGEATFNDVSGNLDAGCGNGKLVAGAVHGAVRLRAGSGEANLGAVYGDVDLASGSGPLSVGLPAGVTARLDLQTGSGQVSSDLPVADKPTVRDGAITVRARTGSGDVRLVRAAA